MVNASGFIQGLGALLIYYAMFGIISSFIGYGKLKAQSGTFGPLEILLIGVLPISLFIVIIVRSMKSEGLSYGP